MSIPPLRFVDSTPTFRFQDLNLEDQCKAALHSLDPAEIKMIVSLAENLDQKDDLSVELLVPLLRKALDEENGEVLNLFFNSSLKDYFFVHKEDLMLGKQKSQEGQAYLFAGFKMALIPDSIPKKQRISCWWVHNIPPKHYQPV